MCARTIRTNHQTDRTAEERTLMFAQAAKDRRKRAKCQLLGYTVIAITAQDLHDPGAMSQWFELIAECLGGE